MAKMITIPVPESKPNKCPFCCAPLVYPRGNTSYCEECGYPEEVRQFDSYETTERIAELEEQAERLEGELKASRNAIICQRKKIEKMKVIAKERPNPPIVAIKGGRFLSKKGEAFE